MQKTPQGHACVSNPGAQRTLHRICMIGCYAHAMLTQYVLCRFQEQLDALEKDNCRLLSEVARVKAQAAEHSQTWQQKAQRVQNDYFKKRRECTEMQKTLEELSSGKNIRDEQLKYAKLKLQGTEGVQCWSVCAMLLIHGRYVISLPAISHCVCQLQAGCCFPPDDGWRS